MTLAAIRPGLDARDSTILDMLERGHDPQRIAEVGRWRRAWTADDVHRIRGQHLPPEPTPDGVRDGARRWTPMQVAEPRTVTLPPAVAAVLDGICAGHTNGQIAHLLGKSEDTIKVQVRALFARLGARDRAHAAALACSGQVRIWVDDRWHRG